MDTTLYRKYRPVDFNNVFGQEQIKKSLINSLDEDKMAHAYLFSGPRGVGKTTIARIIAKGVNCLKKGISSKPCLKCDNCLSITNGSNLDVVEIDAASNRGIDEIRVLKNNINYRPVVCNKKIYIIDEVHMLTNEAFNALLKTLEEPPEHVIFILATTEMHKIPETIISRCVTYNFKTLTKNEIIDMLKYCIKKEKINISDDALELIYEKSSGSARDSFSILEQVYLSNYKEKIDLEMTEKTLGVVPTKYFENLHQIIKNNDAKKLVEFTEDLYINGIKIEQFFKDFCEYLNKNSEDIRFNIDIIGSIYKSLNDFKNEDNQRIISYIIMYNLFEKPQKIIEKQKISNTFDGQKFLIYLEENGYQLLNNILKNFDFDISQNYKIYLKLKTKNRQALSLVKDLKTIREIEEQIFKMTNERYLVELLETKDLKKDKFIDTLVSLFDAERI